jgi:hypothetical protein
VKKFFLLLLALPLPAAAQEPWVNFVRPGYEISFPETPQVEEKIGHLVGVTRGSGDYVLVVRKLAPLVGDRKKELDDMVASYVGKNRDDEAISVNDVVVDGLPGKDIVLRSKSGLRYRFIVTITADRWYYTIATYGSEQFVNGPEANKFRASFKVRPTAKDSPK